MLKRLLDIVIASSALVLLSPVYALVAYKVKKNLGSPVLFRQVRPGLHGKPFKGFRCFLYRYLMTVNSQYDSFYFTGVKHTHGTARIKSCDARTLSIICCHNILLL